MNRRRVFAPALLARGLLLALPLLFLAACAGQVSPPAGQGVVPQTGPTAAVDLQSVATLLVPGQTAVPEISATEAQPMATEAQPMTTETTAPGENIPPAQCSAPAALTPPMTEGPYYTPGAPERTNLIEEGTAGQRLLLTGYVLDSACQPIAGALVDFWQADGNGVYDNSGFKLRGKQTTAADGSYHLETVIPGEYPGRTPHIHVKVSVPASGGRAAAALTTQVFFPGMRGNQTDRIFDPALVVRESQPTGSSAEVLAAFDFIAAK